MPASSKSGRRPTKLEPVRRWRAPRDRAAREKWTKGSPTLPREVPAPPTRQPHLVRHLRRFPAPRSAPVAPSRIPEAESGTDTLPQIPRATKTRTPPRPSGPNVDAPCRRPIVHPTPPDGSARGASVLPASREAHCANAPRHQLPKAANVPLGSAPRGRMTEAAPQVDCRAFGDAGGQRLLTR